MVKVGFGPSLMKTRKWKNMIGQRVSGEADKLWEASQGPFIGIPFRVTLSLEIRMFLSSRYREGTPHLRIL